MDPRSENEPSIPEGGRFVASTGHRVYFPVGAQGWRRIPPRERRWFADEESAAAAGFQPAPTPIDGLDEFDLIAEIGRGATATVYRARDRMLDREVAIKVVHRTHQQDEETLARCHREARVVARLQHPCVVSVYSVRRLPSGGLALVMEYVPGRTLRDLIRDVGPLPVETAERILRDLASALAAAHRQGVVHRDVKPQNIFLHEGTGRSLLADFGIAIPLGEAARITHNGAVIGTPAYMSPEQFEGTSVDGRSDLYSLALVGWEMLTGRSPWQGESLFNIVYLQKTVPVPSLRGLRRDVPTRMRVAIERALAKRPADRWEDVDAFLACLDGQLPGLGNRLAALWPARTRSGAVRQSAPAPTPVPSVADGSGDGPTVRIGEEVARGGRWPHAGIRLSGPPRSRPRMRIAISTLVALAAVAAAGTGLHLQSSTVEREGASIPSQPMVTTAPGRATGTAGSREVPGVSAAGDVALAADASDGTIAVAETAAVDLPGGLDHARPVAGDASEGDMVAAMGEDEAIALEAASADADGTAEAPAVLTAGDTPAYAEAPSPAPSLNLPVDDRPVSLATGGLHSCAVDADGRLACWGGNERGQTARPGTAREALPAALSLPVTARSVAAGGFHSCVLDAAGSAYCWGDNREGQLGVGSSGARGGVGRVEGPRFFALAAGFSHTCGIGRDRATYCWGSNADGQLGDGTRAGRARPVVVDVPEPLASVATGWTHSCGLTRSGAAVCWGGNARGQLGDGSTSTRSSPVTVLGGMLFTAVTAGSAHSCALTSDARAYCWGQNSDGRLGDGTTQDRSVPARVATSERFSAISAGGRHTCALTADGRAFCWGHNGYGQLGDGTDVVRTSPVPVRADLRFIALRSGGSHTCGIARDGTRFCWGFNIEGQLGDGTLTHRSTPTPVQPRQIQDG